MNVLRKKIPLRNKPVAVHLNLLSSLHCLTTSLLPVALCHLSLQSAPQHTKTIYVSLLKANDGATMSLALTFVQSEFNQ